MTNKLIDKVRRTSGYIFLTLGVIIALIIVYINKRATAPIPPFSAYTFLSSSWDIYKKNFIRDEGRVVDISQGEITTSEGQSYAMLRAVWSDDKNTFDKVWEFTKNNLKRPGDNLFGWKWGRRESGDYGFLGEGSENSASDADSDIALALILASRKWGDNSYQEYSKVILRDLWDKNTVVIKNKRYLIAGNWTNFGEYVIINPSYFAPYAWKIFSQVDKQHKWESLISPAYDLLHNSGKNPLDKSTAVGLPPDWIQMNSASGELSAPSIEGLTTNYSYDSIRVPFRVALDYKWFESKEAIDYLNSLQFLKSSYETHGKLASSYSHSGEALNSKESAAMYAMALPLYSITAPNIADKIYKEKIISLYSNGVNAFDIKLPYYEQNLLWFSAAFYNDRLFKL